MQHYDVIVIGAGLGGLVSGAKLAKEGYSVLLIEQHNIVGGCATVFKRKAFTMEVGLHEMDGLDEADPKMEIFHELGVFDHVEFLRLPEFYRFTNKRVDIVIPDDRDDAMKVLIERFPKEQKGIEKFFKTIDALRREINRLPQKRWQTLMLLPIFPLLYPSLTFNTFKTLGTFLNDIIEDEDLKLVLQANIQYYHDDPYTMSLIYFSAAQDSYFRGGYFIKGGSQKLSDYLASIITDHGGEVLLKHKVSKIITENGKVVGVQYHKSRGKDPKIENAYAKVIIANSAIPNVAQMLDPKEQARITDKTKELLHAPSLISLYIGFNKPLKDLGNKHYSTFVFDKKLKSQKEILENNKGDFAKRNFVFVDYSQIDSDLAPEGKSFGVICCLDYCEDWEHMDKEAYKKKKEDVAQTLLRRLESEIPDISNAVEYYEVGTPKTIQRYTLNPGGVPYGYAQVPKQAGIFRVPNKSPIPNLYYASAWTNPGGGFTGAILSGWFCAREVEDALKNNQNKGKKC
jgi:phytoene dehydrogenase-like protein